MVTLQDIAIIAGIFGASSGVVALALNIHSRIEQKKKDREEASRLAREKEEAEERQREERFLDGKIIIGNILEI